MSCSITTHLAFVCCLRWRVPKMTCHLLQHFMLVSPGGILVITLSGLLVKISFDPNLLDGNLPGRQVALPPSHLCRFRQPLWPLLSPLVENYQIPDQGDEQLKSPVPKSSCWRSVWHILPIVRDSPSVAVTSRHIGRLLLQQKIVPGCSRFFSLTAREVKFEASFWPSPPVFPHDVSCLFRLWKQSELPL